MQNLETLIVALAFSAVYTSAGRFHLVQTKFPRRWLSVAAGVSVAYVFMDILPELEARRRGFVTAIGGDVLFAEQRIYIAALLGFVFFYGLDHFALPSQPHGEEAASGARFWLHIGGYALYSWLIGYLLVDRVAMGGLSLGLYGSAMVLHLAVVGHGLVEKHGWAYDRLGAWVLAASILAGWLMSVTVRMPEIMMARLFGFVGGGVVMTSMNEELPGERGGRFWWFLAGSMGCAILLLLA